MWFSRSGRGCHILPPPRSCVQTRRVGHGAQQAGFPVPDAVEEQKRRHVRGVLIVPGSMRPQRRLAAAIFRVQARALPGGALLVRAELGRDEPVERPPVRGRRGVSLAVNQGHQVAPLVRRHQRRALELWELGEAAGVLQEGGTGGGGRRCTIRLRRRLLLEARRRAGDDGIVVVRVAPVPCSSDAAPWWVHCSLLERSAHHPAFFLRAYRVLASRS